MVDNEVDLTLSSLGSKKSADISNVVNVDPMMPSKKEKSAVSVFVPNGCRKSADIINIDVIMTSRKNSNESFSMSIDDKYDNLPSSPVGEYYFPLQLPKQVTEKEKSYVTFEEFNYTMNLLNLKVSTLYKLCRYISNQQQENSKSLEKLVALDELSDYFWNIFAAFGKEKLDYIDSTTSPLKIAEWKASEKTRVAYNELFSNHDLLSKISYAVFKQHKDKELPTMHCAYILSICDILLNPKSSGIKCNDKSICADFIKNFSLTCVDRVADLCRNLGRRSLQIFTLKNLLMNAISTEFQGVQNKGCHFHLSQNIYRKMQEFGLTVQYRTDKTFSLLICHIPALAFLPHNNIPSSFDELRAIMPEEANSIMEWFKIYYIHEPRTSSKHGIGDGIHWWVVHT
ncbi:hypothetical protein C1646_803692 [Rhizophagus diaphanus]|nr:hypothetical protein C1646_803692 [Rhizophagus diaphanus] [Rhizophagus sp. MUCL 43196]